MFHQSRLMRRTWRSLSFSSKSQQKSQGKRQARLRLEQTGKRQLAVLPLVDLAMFFRAKFTVTG